MSYLQKTIARPVRCSGVGVHTGLKAQLCIRPASPDHGIRFRRVSNGKAIGQNIPACARHVSGLTLGTTLSNTQGDSVATVEHLMAACIGMGIDNLLIEIDGPEVPIMDGSAAVFCELLEAAGLIEQGAPRKVLRVLNTVEVRDGAKWARLQPCVTDGLNLSARIDFENPVIGVQEASLRLNPGTFNGDIGFARTFGFSKDVDAMQAMGYARGGSLENAILIEGERIVNSEGLRSHDEFVRHKLLDALGDLALAGGAIAGRYEAECPGHALNNALLLKLLDTPDAWCWETLAVKKATPQLDGHLEMHA